MQIFSPRNVWRNIPQKTVHTVNVKKIGSKGFGTMVPRFHYLQLCLFSKYSIGKHHFIMAQIPDSRSHGHGLTFHRRELPSCIYCCPAVFFPLLSLISYSRVYDSKTSWPSPNKRSPNDFRISLARLFIVVQCSRVRIFGSRSTEQWEWPDKSRLGSSTKGVVLLSASYEKYSIRDRSHNGGVVFCFVFVFLYVIFWGLGGGGGGCCCFFLFFFGGGGGLVLFLDTQHTYNTWTKDQDIVVDSLKFQCWCDTIPIFAYFLNKLLRLELCKIATNLVQVMQVLSISLIILTLQLYLFTAVL